MTVAIKEKERCAAVVGTKYWTIADLALLPDQLATGPAKWELWDGEFRLMPPPADIHGSVQSQSAWLFTTYGQSRGYGLSRGEVAVVVTSDEPQACLAPDAAFIAADQLPIRRSPEGYLLTVPAIVVEVRSPNDRRGGVAEKVKRYLGAGARLVWVLDPAKRSLTIHQVGKEARSLGPDETLTAEEIIPGLQCRVSLLFEGMDGTGVKNG